METSEEARDALLESFLHHDREMREMNTVVEGKKKIWMSLTKAGDRWFIFAWNLMNMTDRQYFKTKMAEMCEVEIGGFDVHIEEKAQCAVIFYLVGDLPKSDLHRLHTTGA